VAVCVPGPAHCSHMLLALRGSASRRTVSLDSTLPRCQRCGEFRNYSLWRAADPHERGAGLCSGTRRCSTPSRLTRDPRGMRGLLLLRKRCSPLGAMHGCTKSHAASRRSQRIHQLGRGRTPRLPKVATKGFEFGPHCSSGGLNPFTVARAASRARGTQPSGPKAPIDSPPAALTVATCAVATSRVRRSVATSAVTSGSGGMAAAAVM